MFRRTEAFERVLPLIPKWAEGFNIPQKEEAAREILLSVAAHCPEEVLTSTDRFEAYARKAIESRLFKKERQKKSLKVYTRREPIVVPLACNTYLLKGRIEDILPSLGEEREESLLYWG